MFTTIFRRFGYFLALFYRRLSEKVTGQERSLSRQEIAARYLTGTGLEIGALHNPLPVPAEVTVRYVDRMPVEELRKHYPELEKHFIIAPDIIDDGEILATVPDSSLDFVIANHMIEHSQDPITALKNWLRVIRHGGIVYLVVPDKRHTFDKDRPITSINHVMLDYVQGTERSRENHFREWAESMYKLPENEALARVRELMEMNYSIHYHVWTPKDFFEFLMHCQRKLHFPFRIEMFQENKDEVVVILRRNQVSDTQPL